MQLDAGSVLRDNWGRDILQFCLDLHAATEAFQREEADGAAPEAGWSMS